MKEETAGYSFDPVRWGREYSAALEKDPAARPSLVRMGMLESQVIRERLAAGDEGVAERHNMMFLDVGSAQAHLPLGARLAHLNGELAQICRKVGVAEHEAEVPPITVAEVMEAVRSARSAGRH